MSAIHLTGGRWVQTGHMKFVKQQGCADAVVETLMVTDPTPRYPDGTEVGSETVTIEQYREMEARRLAALSAESPE